jgi:hypothetical protein
VPNATSGSSAALAASQATDMIAGDLFYATSITTASAAELLFNVPDRTGDGMPETIRYFWSGTSGDPLTRQFNNGAAAVVVQDVREFQLAYGKRKVTLPTTYSDGAEVLLASYNGSYFLDGATIDSSSLVGQYFQPTLPANAKSWKVTRVRIKAKKHGAPDGETKVQLRLPNGTVPGDYVVEERSMMESALSGSYQWMEFPFTNTAGLLPGSALCLVLAGTSSADSCDVRYQSFWAWPDNSQYVTSGNGGANWFMPAGQSLIFYVYGTVSTPDPASYQYLLTDVRATLRSGPDPWSRMQTSVRIVNEPQVNGP